MVLPREGALTGTTNVHIYGRNFTKAICKNITCYFGEEPSPKAMYISNNHVICQAPDISQNVLQYKYNPKIHPDPIQMLLAITEHSKELDAEVSVPISVDFGDGNPVEVGQNFTYKYDRYTTTTTNPSTTEHKDSASVSTCYTLTCIIISVLYSLLKQL